MPAFPAIPYAPWVVPLLRAAGQVVLLGVVQWTLGRLAARLRAALRVAEEAGAFRRRRWLLIALAVYPRLCVWLWVCGLYTTVTWHVAGGMPGGGEQWMGNRPWQERFISIVTLLCTMSGVGRLLSLTNHRLRAAVAADVSHWERLFGVLVAESLRLGLPLAAAYGLVPLLGLSAGVEAGVRRTLTLGVIGVVGFVLAQLVNLAAEKIALTHEATDYGKNLRARTLYTQVAVLRRVALLVIGFVSLASMLMVFPSVRQLGTSLLASAGVLGIVAGVASQRSLANLVAGFQIAVTQPILLDDEVKVEGEFGTVEEITLTYVVVRLWDLRRLVLPISYFLEKPFQNWTRTSPNLMGAVFLPVGYRTDLGPLGDEFTRVLETQRAAGLWNGQTQSLHVTEANERGMEVRLLVSADNAGALFDLRCAVRRALIEFLNREQPGALPTRLHVAVDHAPGAAAETADGHQEDGIAETPSRL